MRLVPFTLGLLVLAMAWNSGTHSFSGHMTVHVSVVAVAAPLLALAVAGGSFDPVYRGPEWFSPILASIVELGAVWVWHTPLLHQAARENILALIAEQASFLFSGFYLWIAVLGGDAVERHHRAATGVVALLLTAMHMTLLGALLALSPRPLYEQVHTASSLSPLDDQHLGGAIMLLVGGISYLAGGLWLSAGLLRSGDSPR